MIARRSAGTNQLVEKSLKVHAVLSSTDELGGPTTIINVWTTQKFVGANPLSS